MPFACDGTCTAIPSAIEILGTARVREVAVCEDLPDLVDQHLKDVTASSGAGVEVDYRRGSPPNTASLWGRSV